jgi:predicted alpha/beta-hydrolase family hydrolase
MRGAGTCEVVAGVRVTTLLVRPDRARALLLLGHGAGAGMRHPFMEGLAKGLAGQGVATFRYQFPYAERGSRRPDPPARLLETVRAAAACARGAAGDLPFFAGGKSMGGRITSMAAADGALSEARGLVLVGYPLHPPGGSGATSPPSPQRDRRRHLHQVGVPMLFLQGARDKLANIEEMRALCRELGPAAELLEVPDADHSFHVPARSGRNDTQVLVDLCAATARWIDRHLGP